MDDKIEVLIAAVQQVIENAEPGSVETWRGSGEYEPDGTMVVRREDWASLKAAVEGVRGAPGG